MYNFCRIYITHDLSAISNDWSCRPCIYCSARTPLSMTFHNWLITHATHTWLTYVCMCVLNQPILLSISLTVTTRGLCSASSYIHSIMHITWTTNYIINAITTVSLTMVCMYVCVYVSYISHAAQHMHVEWCMSIVCITAKAIKYTDYMLMAFSACSIYIYMYV